MRICVCVCVQALNRSQLTGQPRGYMYTAERGVDGRMRKARGRGRGREEPGRRQQSWKLRLRNTERDRYESGRHGQGSQLGAEHHKARFMMI
jgi:hypothetical protein